jgi:peptidoglycan/LPS O-acetylase OafA/YrhL
MFSSIQALRVLAATLVVLMHVMFTLHDAVPALGLAEPALWQV